MNKIKPLLFLLIIVFGKTLSSQNTAENSYTLTQAIEYALKNNTQIKNANLDIKIASNKVKETTAIGLPQVNSKLAYQNIFDVPVMVMPTLITIPDQNNPLLHTHQLYNAELELGVKENITLDVTVSQLLFSGEYIIGLSAAKTYKQLSIQLKKKTEINIIESISELYYSILVLNQNKDGLNKTVENLKKNIIELKSIYKAGFIEDTDIDQLNLTIKNLENNINSIENQKNTLILLLKMNMGIESDKNISLSDNLETVLTKIELNNPLTNNYSIENNISIKLSNTQEKLNQLNYKREMSTFLPSISAFYNHQELKDKPVFNFNPPNVVGVNVNIPIFGSGLKLAKVQQAKLDYIKSKNNTIQATDAIKIELTKTINEFNQKLKTYENQKQSLELSEKIYEKGLIKFKEGIISSIDLSQLQNQFLNAQTNYFNSILDLLNTKTKLDSLLKN